MNINLTSKYISQNFGKKAFSYNDFAKVQEYSNLKLIEYTLLNKYFNDTDQKNILDIGAGTGNLIKSLEHYNINFSHIIQLDLSLEMLKYNKSNLFKNNISYINCDMNNLTFIHNSFDYIFANFVLHWCKDLGQFFYNLYNILKQNAYAIIALPINSSLHEIRQSFEINGVSNKIFAFPQYENIIHYITNSNLVVEKKFSEIIIQESLSINSFFKTLRKYGGNISNRQIIKKSKYLAIEKYYNDNFYNNKAQNSWEIAYFIVRKK